MNTVVLVLRALLAVTFAAAGTAKLADLRGSRRTVLEFGMPERVAAVGGSLLPFAELATAAALLPQPTARWGAVAALLLLLVFTAGIANALANGRRPDCNCFGRAASERVSVRTIARNVVIACAAAVVAWKAPGTSVSSWIGGRHGGDLAAGLLAIVAAVLGVSTLRFWRLSRALRDHLFETSSELASLPRGLPVGLFAPAFELPDLDGHARSLADFCLLGRPVVLVFTSGDCGPCIRLMPEVGRWAHALAERITLVLIANAPAEPESLRAQIKGAGDPITLVQERHEVADAYRVRSTPTAVVVAPDGRIASTLTGGPPEIEELVRVTLRGQHPEIPYPTSSLVAG